MRWLALCLLLLPLAARANQVDGTCTTTSGGTNWTNAPNIKTDDANQAVYNSTGQDLLGVTTCGFSSTIGADDQIDGIEITLKGCGQATTAARRRVKVNVEGAGTCTAKTALDQAQCSTITTQTVGGAADKWSCTGLDAAAVRSASFGANITDNDTTAHELDQNYLTIRVYYTPATTTTSTSSSTTSSTSTTTSTTLAATFWSGQPIVM